MRFDKCALLCAILALSILEPIAARKGFGFSGGRSHSYPKSGGLSGGHSGSHSYPSSGGHSGSHSYPSSGGSSGTGTHHGYPASGGISGSGQRNPGSGGSHGYPSSGGSHSYPSSGSGLSGNSRPSGTTNVHHHYHYTPPQQISYVPHRGAAPVSYPVYRGTPPTYVYQYKDSGSKYGTLLAGLALLNLGTLAAGTAYAVSHSHSGQSSYKAQPGEICKFGVRRSNSDYEETRIDCQLITSFIFQEEARRQAQGAHNSTTITTTTTVTNVTMANNTNPINPVSAPVNQTAVKVLYEMLPNGTLVPVNVTVNATENATSSPVASSNAPSAVSVTTTTTNTTVTNALDVKGKPIDVTPDMECYVIRTSPTSNMRKSVPCGLLQTYAEKSISRNSGFRSVPTFAILTVVFAVLVLN